METYEIEVSKHVTPVIESAVDFVVKDAESMAAGAALLDAIADAKMKVEAAFDEGISTAHRLHKQLLDTKGRYYTPLIEAEQSIKRGMSRFLESEELKRRTEEARLQAIAKKQEEERRAEEAAHLQAAGKPEAAEAVLSAPITAANITLAPPPKVAGIAARDKWTYIILDESKIPDEYWKLDESRIASTVRNLKDKTRIPGIQVVNEKTISMRK